MSLLKTEREEVKLKQIPLRDAQGGFFRRNRRKRRKKDCKLGDKKFASPLEVRMAKILDKAGIKYRDHVVVGIPGKEGGREIDFCLEAPIFARDVRAAVQFIEVKGHNEAPKQRTEDQWSDLMRVGCHTLVVSYRLLELWEKEGFLDPDRVQPICVEDIATWDLLMQISELPTGDKCAIKRFLENLLKERSDKLN